MTTQSVTGGTGILSRGGARTCLRGLMLLCLFLATAVPATAFAASALTGIDYSTLPGNRVRLTLTLDGPAPEPRSFRTANPARIALDLMGVTNALEQRSVDIGVGAVLGVATAEAGGRTRVVIRLSELVPFEMEREGNQLYVLLNSSAAGAADSGAAADAENRITKVDFQRGPDGTGRIIVHLSDASVPVNVRNEGGRVIADFLDTTAPERLQVQLDVTAFATPVKTIETRQLGDRVRMVINPEDNYEQIAYQANETFTIEITPVEEEQQGEPGRGEIHYTGERLSLNFQDIEVRSVLQLIADFTGLNIVVSDSVSGNITLRLESVPWDQALAIILKTQGLDKRVVGNVMLVAPAEEIAAREKLELQTRQQIRQLAPLRTEFMRLSYAEAAQMAALIEGGEAGRSLLSERGSVAIDERTNTLIVQDVALNLGEIRSLVAQLDIPVRQVLIESRIVIANNDFTNEIGVRFGYSRNDQVDDMGAVVGGTLPGQFDYNGITAFEVPAGSGNEGLLVDLPVADAAGAVGLAVGKIGSYLLQLELSAMEQEGRGEIISSPRVVTASGHEAVIEQGFEIPYQAATSSGATSVEFKEAVLSLEVTPRITPDDRVIMDLTVTKDQPDFSRAVLGTPPLSTREVSTQVLVDNGETVVLGGVYERTHTKNVTRVPFFGELPVIGWLFRTREKVDNNSELLIFVTPKIIEEDLALN